MPVHELAQLTWEEVRDLDRARTIVVLPVGAIEAHGPHLPLDTDVVIATAMARDGARKLAAHGGGGGRGGRMVLLHAPRPCPAPGLPAPSPRPRPLFGAARTRTILAVALT